MTKLILTMICAVFFTSPSWAILESSSAEKPDEVGASTPVQEGKALHEDFAKIFERFVVAGFKNSALDEKVSEDMMESMMSVEAEALEALRANIKTTDSLVPAKKAIKKLMLLLCEPLGLKPAEDMPVKELMDLVSKHLKDKYGV